MFAWLVIQRAGLRALAVHCTGSPNVQGEKTVGPKYVTKHVQRSDSITDGRGSTTNGNDRWPDVPASRLQEDAARQNQLPS